MRVFIIGVCGFVGSALAEALLEFREGISVFGVDNLQRPGSEMNRGALRSLGVRVIHGDIRMASDLESLPPTRRLGDRRRRQSERVGRRQGQWQQRQLFEHNLASLVNVLEYCKKYKAGLLLLSSSRVYSIPQLASLPLKICGDAFRLDASRILPQGVSEQGIGPGFSTAPPISLYGCTKLACEIVAVEADPAQELSVTRGRAS
jgi:CDP-paratose 2-epimerase